MIIPMYNCELWITNLIQDLQAQTFTNFEVLLIDDGSSDSTYTICINLCKKDQRFSIFTQKNKGPGAARNLGIQLSNGEYIRFLDADDRIEENSLEMLVKPFLLDPTIDLVIGHFSHGRQTWQSDLKGTQTLATLVDDFSNDFFGMFYGLSPNKTYKSSIIKENNLKEPEDIRWCEDYLFNLTYYHFVSKVHYVSENIYTYLIIDGSLVSQVKLLDRNAIETRCIKKLKGFLLNKNFYNKQSIRKKYDRSVAYLLYSQMCNVVQGKLGYEHFKRDCLTTEKREFWLNYKIHDIRIFYRVVKFLFKFDLSRGIYYFIYSKESLKKVIKND